MVWDNVKTDKILEIIIIYFSHNIHDCMIRNEYSILVLSEESLYIGEFTKWMTMEQKTLKFDGP